MAFPDRIERTVEIAHPPAKVWAAPPTAEGLGAWFGDDAAIDLRPGGAHRTAYDGNSDGWAKELAELTGYLDAA
jgi:uncharacterized protein YndB with AHSA1/START domain